MILKSKCCFRTSASCIQVKRLSTNRAGHTAANSSSVTRKKALFFFSFAPKFPTVGRSHCAIISQVRLKRFCKARVTRAFGDCASLPCTGESCGDVVFQTSSGSLLFKARRATWVRTAGVQSSVQPRARAALVRPAAAGVASCTSCCTRSCVQCTDPAKQSCFSVVKCSASLGIALNLWTPVYGTIGGH